MNLKNFTLKVKRTSEGKIVPDARHDFGGIDANQIVMFRHIAPNGECYEMMIEQFQNLVEAHGWCLEITNEF